MHTYTTTNEALASPAESATRYARIGAETFPVEFVGWRYSWSTGREVASIWRVLADAERSELGALAEPFNQRGDHLELLASDLLPLVCINTPEAQR